MKKILAWCLVVSLLWMPAGVLAGKGGQKGPSDKAYEKANENADFKRADEGPPSKDKEKKKKAKKNKRGSQESDEGVVTLDDENGGSSPGLKQKKGKGKKK